MTSTEYGLISKRPVSFVLGRKLGEGSGGKVYVAEMEGRQVAIKYTPTRYVTIDYGPMLEASVMTSLYHPHLVKLVECFLAGKDRDRYTLLVTDLAWRDFGAFIDEGGDRSTRREILYQTGLALDYLHRHSIVHGDMKPENILLYQKNGKIVAKVGDLGLFRDSGCLLRQENAVVFTCEYRPPENFLGGRASVEGDAWAFVVLCYTAVESNLLTNAINIDLSPTQKSVAGIKDLLCLVKVLSLFYPVPASSSIRKLPRWTDRLEPAARSVVPTSNPVLADLLVKGLRLEPVERPTILQILGHPFFSGFPVPLSHAETCRGLVVDRELEGKAAQPPERFVRNIFDVSSSLRTKCLACRFLQLGFVPGMNDRQTMIVTRASVTLAHIMCQEDLDTPNYPLGDKEYADGEKEFLKRIGIDVYRVSGWEIIEYLEISATAKSIARSLYALSFFTDLHVSHSDGKVILLCAFLAALVQPVPEDVPSGYYQPATREMAAKLIGAEAYARRVSLNPQVLNDAKRMLGRSPT